MQKVQTMKHVRTIISKSPVGNGLTRAFVQKELQKMGYKRTDQQVNLALYNLYEQNELDRSDVHGVYVVPGKALKTAAADTPAQTIKIPAKSSYPRVVGELTTGEIIMSFNGNVYSCTQI